MSPRLNASSPSRLGAAGPVVARVEWALVRCVRLVVAPPAAISHPTPARGAIVGRQRLLRARSRSGAGRSRASSARGRRPPSAYGSACSGSPGGVEVVGEVEHALRRGGLNAPGHRGALSGVGQPRRAAARATGRAGTPLSGVEVEPHDVAAAGCRARPGSSAAAGRPIGCVAHSEKNAQAQPRRRGSRARPQAAGQAARRQRPGSRPGPRPSARARAASHRHRRRAGWTRRVAEHLGGHERLPPEHDHVGHLGRDRSCHRLDLTTCGSRRRAASPARRRSRAGPWRRLDRRSEARADDQHVPLGVVPRAQPSAARPSARRPTGSRRG